MTEESNVSPVVMERLRSARQFDLQAAGHAALLALDDGLLVKPCNARERTFYEHVAAAGQTGEVGAIGEFRTFMPRYFGSLRLATEEEREAWRTSGAALPDTDGTAEKRGITEGICIENITYSYYKPCVMDLKIGRELCSDDATPEKRARMEVKAANSTTAALGIRICGMMVHDLATGDYINYNKQFGYRLTADTITEGFSAYFAGLPIDNAWRESVIEEFQEELAHFRDVLRTVDVRLRSASLLFVYEADPAGAAQKRREQREERAKRRAQKASDKEADAPSLDGAASEEDSESDDDEDDDEDGMFESEHANADMRIVDFAHSFWESGIGPDQGCIEGVQNAIDILGKLLPSKQT